MENLVTNPLFNKIYNNKKVLITGHTGFKGSWLSLWLNKLGAHVTGYALAPHTQPNHFNILNTEINSIIEDLSSYETLEKTIAKSNPEIIFHLAAQPYVIESYHNPLNTYQTNVMGTLNVLEAARKNSNVKAIVLITTDKVYQNTEKKTGYTEDERLGGYDPYSSSKACCELLINSYRDSFLNIKNYNSEHNTLIASARAGNVIGGGDWGNNRLIPDIVKNAACNNITTLRNPTAVRPWQHVLESLSGYLLLGQKLLEENTNFSGAWNFGPNYNKEIAVKELAEILKTQWDKVKFKETNNSTNKYHETQILKLNSSKSINKLNWTPLWDGKKAIEQTIKWYKDFYDSKNIISQQQLDEYIKEGINKKVIWTQ